MVENDYLKNFIDRVQSVLQENLISLYIIGSLSLDDYTEDHSDIDIFGITSRTLTDIERDQLADVLDSTNFHCPSKGLDVVLLSKHNIKNISPQPKFEFWYSTGAEWPKEKWEKGANTEMIIFIELCRQNGIKIFGEELKFGTISKKLILDALKHIISWHKHHILDDHHDPNGQNSVLNACRILKYAETNKFYSKTEGGKLFLQDYPKNVTVRNVLLKRQKEVADKISKKQILELLNFVEIKLDQELS